MTYYFDMKGVAIQAVQRSIAENGGSLRQEDHVALRTIDAEIVFDVSIATQMQWFPAGIAARIHRAVLTHSSAAQPYNGKCPEYDTPNDHIEGLFKLNGDLHTIFHDLAEMRYANFSDDPKMPLRCLYANAQKVREDMARQDLMKDLEK